jgi:hypothetical protein
MYSDVLNLDEMKRWLVQHHIAAVELFIKTESVTALQCRFQQQLQRRKVLAAILCYCGF